MVAPDAPVQRQMRSVRPFHHAGHVITPLASFNLTARVLSKKKYRLDDQSALSPVDLALGWGNMSNEAVLDKIHISQSRRWYRWRTENPPIPLREIATHSANMHMVPASKVVEEKLVDIVKGEVVTINGFLIQADTASGSRWRSSLTRNDTGSQACELVWVEEIEVL